MYSITPSGNEITDVEAEAEIDIETEINREVENMKIAKEEALFKAIKIDIMCGKLTALHRGVCS